ncbi:hypothetical protein BC835DRAFT_1309412 [Cytidiella melzeri]|nr:hypothetical protein BC835DRAFT_1309412 [Cytidiella melzeri]
MTQRLLIEQRKSRKKLRGRGCETRDWITNHITAVQQATSCTAALHNLGMALPHQTAQHERPMTKRHPEIPSQQSPCMNKRYIYRAQSYEDAFKFGIAAKHRLRSHAAQNLSQVTPYIKAGGYEDATYKHVRHLQTAEPIWMTQVRVDLLLLRIKEDVNWRINISLSGSNIGDEEDLEELTHLGKVWTFGRV